MSRKRGSTRKQRYSRGPNRFVSRTKSQREQMREELGLINLKDTRFTIDPISLIILGIGIWVYATLWSRTFEEQQFDLFFFVRLFIVMMVIGFIGGSSIQFLDNWFTRKEAKLNLYDIRDAFKPKKVERTSLFFLIFVGGFVGLGITQFVVGATQSITDIELYLFYSFASVAEEFFYRYFITQLIYLSLYKTIKSFNERRKLITDVAIIIVSLAISVPAVSYFFMASHFQRYGDLPTILTGVFISSLILTVIYIMTKNTLIVLLLHLLVNLIVFGSLLGSALGVGT